MDVIKFKHWKMANIKNEGGCVSIKRVYITELEA